MNKGALAGRGGRFMSAEFAVPTTGAFASVSVLHGLGTVPIMARAVIVCRTAEAGYQVDDEVDVSGVFATVSAINAGVAVNAASITLINLGGTTNWNIGNRTNGALVVITKANWRVKFYAMA
jgi:hypothetical protein